jgi:hypothetical protein
MPDVKNLPASALAYLPAPTVAGTGIAVKIIFHSSALAGLMAGLAGVFTVLGVFAVSAQAHETLRLWIRHHAEHKIAAAEAYETKWRIHAATCGRRWTRDGSAQIRDSAAKYPRTGSSLTEIMAITRQLSPGETPPGLPAIEENPLLMGGTTATAFDAQMTDPLSPKTPAGAGASPAS